jgi:23S rRNA (cytosine1962-C5)-methyltransferase
VINDRDIRLVDAGDGRRLEVFGERLVDRPHPGAVERRGRPGSWGAADLRFDRGRGWTGRADPSAPWTVFVEGLTLELRATESGGIGLFPEQILNVAWLGSEIRTVPAAESRAPSVLNLFAHTGLLTLAAARAGATVTHVDAARGTVAWARRNAELSGLSEAPIRWIVDDALGFVRREARRGRRYDGVLLDPPSYGHGSGHTWRFESDLPEFLEACAAVAATDAFVLVTAHTTGLEDDWLVGAIREAFPRLARRLEAMPLELEAESGAVLRLGTAVRGSR